MNSLAHIDSVLQNPESRGSAALKAPSPSSKPRNAKLYRGLVDLRSPSASITAITRINHAQCGFLKLPAELRIHVYRIVIGEREVHIVPVPYYGAGLRVTQGRHNSGRTQYLYGARHFPRPRDGLNRHSFTPIWHVCRQFYIEASIFLYSDNVFSFQVTWVATSFFNALQMPQCEALRILRFPGLKEFYAVRSTCLKRLTGLKRIELERTPREPEHAVRKLAAALPGKIVQVVFLSEMTISEVRESRRRLRYQF